MPQISFKLLSTCPRTGARLYEAKLGRFLIRDPIGQEDGLNLYAYCNNNPVNCVDPDGKDAQLATKRITENRSLIFKVASDHGIQPELLAGAMWMEANGNGKHSWMVPLNEMASQMKFVGWRRLASLGWLQVQIDPNRGILNSMTTSQDGLYLRYISSPARMLGDGASRLRALVGRPNRYPNRMNNLTAHEMSIILTEYNKGPIASSAANARAGKYGNGFLKALPTIRKLLGGN